MKQRIANLGLMSGLALFVAIASVAGYYFERGFPSLDAQHTVASNLGFFLLINLNIIVVMILAFLVAKNIVRLVLDRRQRILGSRLRSRLVAAFVGLSLIPTVLLFMLAKGMLERVLQGWFSPQIAASVDGAVAVARYHYDSAEAQVYRHTHYLARKLDALYPYLRDGTSDRSMIKQVLQGYLHEKREEYGLYTVAVVDAMGQEVTVAQSIQARHGTVASPGPNAEALEDAKNGSIVVRAEQSIDGEFLRGYAPISASPISGLVGSVLEQSPGTTDNAAEAAKAPSPYALVVTLWVAPELSASLGSVINAYDDYKELKSYRRPLVSSYLLTLIVVTLLIIFSAIWVGFYLARGISIPIGLLAEGTKQVAHGNLDYQIPEVGDDEISELVRYFNKMTKDLKETTGELVARRSYMETVLARVGVGVMSVDRENRVTTLNIAAADMLGLTPTLALFRTDFREVLPKALATTIEEELRKLYSGIEKLISSNVTLDLPSGLKHIQLTITELVDEKNSNLGAVVLLDNITELVSAQRMAAWREVARRIAHEIKNPLTPIQLNAERLQRKFARPGADGPVGDEKDRSIIAEATDVIIKQVIDLRTLVNEFSNFARMPKVNPRPGVINEVIKEAAAVFSESNPDVVFKVELSAGIPVFSFDREQMSRVLINLISNALAAVSANRGAEREEGWVDVRGEPDREGLGAVQIASAYDESLGLVSVSISDNGPGIKERDKQKIFEPYFTTKRGGTGLGLTIVSTIVQDHNGFVRVRDNIPRGAVFTVELPVSREVISKY